MKLTAQWKIYVEQMIEVFRFNDFWKQNQIIFLKIDVNVYKNTLYRQKTYSLFDKK